MTYISTTQFMYVCGYYVVRSTTVHQEAGTGRAASFFPPPTRSTFDISMIPNC